MPDLERLLRHGDPGRIVKFFAGMTETERQPYVSQVVAWRALLDLNRRAGFSRKAAAELARRETIKNHYELAPAADAALAACGSLSQLKSGEFVSRAAPEIVVALWQDRRPPWIDEYVQARLGEELTSWLTGWHWR